MNEKRIILGVCGSIASYKSLELVRLLKKEQVEVQVMLTPSACAFVTPLSFSTLSGRPALSALSSEAGTWNNHVEMASWADLLLIAPLTAHTLAKLCHGFCDNLLLATYLSFRGPVMAAPAMDVDMYHHTTTQEHINLLKARGHCVLDSPEGELASGLEGAGRMMEPSDILGEVRRHFSFSTRFLGKRVLITAGPTWEKIDDVRFIANASSGKMGYAIAEAFAAGGASVDLVSGPTHLRARHPRIKVYGVQSAQEMHEQCVQIHKDCNVAVFVAAVGDFRPQKYTEGKMKKTQKDHLTLSLEKNIDIARDLGERKERRIHVGFALEDAHDTDEAKRKLREKSLDLVVLNTIADPGAGFGGSTNRVTLIDSEGEEQSSGLKSKREIAYDIADFVHQKIHEPHLVS